MVSTTRVMFVATLLVVGCGESRARKHQPHRSLPRRGWHPDNGFPTTSQSWPPRGGGGDENNAVATAVAKGVAARTLEGLVQGARELVGTADSWGWGGGILCGFAAAALVLAGWELMVVAGSPPRADALAVACLVLAPTAAVLQRKVALLEGLRKITNDLREQVNLVSASNRELKSQNKQLEKNTKSLRESQSALEQIGSDQGITVDKLVEQVNEYSRIQEAVKDGLRNQIRQTLVSVVLKSDKDDDFVIGPDEVDRLVLRLKNLPSVQFDEARFRRVFQKEGGDIANFIETHLGRDTDYQKEGIFVF